MILEVVLHPPCLAHAETGEDDGAAMNAADRLALLYRLDQGKITGCKRVSIFAAFSNVGAAKGRRFSLMRSQASIAAAARSGG
jgi:hypothetical protein